MDNIDLIATIGILVAAFALFISGKMRVDLVAACVLVALLAFGLITPEEGLLGFANPATVTIGAMFIVGAGLVRTGIVQKAAGWIDWLAGRGESRLVLILCIITAILSAFLVNTATVAILIPVVITLAAKRKIASSRVLIPLSFSSQFGGVCTIIGTSTNMLVNGIGISRGMESFSFFEFAPLGLIMVGAGIIYLLFAGKWLLPKRKEEGDQIDKYRLADYQAEVLVLGDSGLAGKTWSENKIPDDAGIEMVNLLREGEEVSRPKRTKIRPGDLLLLRGNVRKIIEAENSYGLEMQMNAARHSHESEEGTRLVEVLIPPASNLAGQTINDASFFKHYPHSVLAIQRRGETLKDRIGDIKLESGDTVLVHGHEDDIRKLSVSPHVIVISELSGIEIRNDKALMAAAILVTVIVLAVTGIVSIMIAAIIGAVAMILFRCITVEEGYASIDWKIIFLLGGIIPLGIAMENNGVVQLLADTVLEPLITFGPVAILAILYIVVAFMTEGMSNNAVAAIMVPVAFSLAAILEVDPRPFLVAITFAASTSFATPIGYQTNTMVYAAGGYKFTDFARIGIPLNIIYWVLAIVLIPVFWPF